MTYKDNVAYNPFHNQLRQDEFPIFIKTLVKSAMAVFTGDIVCSLPKKLDCFYNVLLQDGSSFVSTMDWVMFSQVGSSALPMLSSAL